MTELTPDEQELRGRIIDLLKLHQPLSPSQMVAMTGCDRPSLDRVLENLETLSVARKHDPLRV